MCVAIKFGLKFTSGSVSLKLGAFTTKEIQTFNIFGKCILIFVFYFHEVRILAVILAKGKILNKSNILCV